MSYQKTTQNLPSVKWITHFTLEIGYQILLDPYLGYYEFIDDKISDFNETMLAWGVWGVLHMPHTPKFWDNTNFHYLQLR